MIFLKTFPKPIKNLNLRSSFIMAPPMTILSTLCGYFSARFLIKTVPREIPMKWDFSIFKKSITSTISFVIESKSYFSLNTLLRLGFELPCPLRSNSSTLKCFLNSLTCLNHIEELPPAPCTKVTQVVESL